MSEKYFDNKIFKHANIKKDEKGITLTYLVITVMVMIILAVIAVGTTMDTTSEKYIDDETNRLTDMYENDLEEIEMLKEKVQESNYETVNMPEEKNQILKEVKDPENFGKITTYKSSGLNEINWKLFYADDEYVYLIADEVESTETLEYSKYESLNLTMQNDLKKLNSKLFENSVNSENTNIKAINYFMDQDTWDKYKDANGDAEYIIAVPTLELYAKSYNAMAKSKGIDSRIKYTCNGNGYQIDSSSDGIIERAYGNKIYSSSATKYSKWYLASPSSESSNKMIAVDRASKSLCTIENTQALVARPVVMIPVDKFISGNYNFE